MKTRAWIVPVLAVLVSGCIRFEQNMILKVDGSGTLELRYSIAEQTISQIEAMNKLRKEMETASGLTVPDGEPKGFSRYLFNPQSDELAVKLKEYEALGVVTEKIETKSRDIRRNVHIKLRFENLEALARTDFFQTFGFSVRKTSGGQYILDREPNPSKSAVRPDFSDPETARMVAPLLNGFSVALSLSTPGRIIETTGERPGPYTTTWSYEFEREANALIALRNQRFRVVFEGEGIELPEIRRPDPKATDPAPAER